MTSMTEDLKFFFVVVFVLLVTFELLSHYPNIDSSNLIKQNVQWIPDKIFREKLLVKMASTISHIFLLNFWFLPVFVVVFIVIRLIVMSYRLPMNDKCHCTHIGLYLSVFIDFR